MVHQYTAQCVTNKVDQYTVICHKYTTHRFTNTQRNDSQIHNVSHTQCFELHIDSQMHNVSQLHNTLLHICMIWNYTKLHKYTTHDITNTQCVTLPNVSHVHKYSHVHNTMIRKRIRYTYTMFHKYTTQCFVYTQHYDPRIRDASQIQYDT